MEEIEPEETLESYFGRTKKKRKILNNKPLNDFILRNYGVAENKYPKSQPNMIQTRSPSINSSGNPRYLQAISKLKSTSIHDKNFQEQIHKALEYTENDKKEESRYHKTKPHFPLRFTPNLKSKSKWQVRWHPKITAMVKFAYQIFYGSINTNNPSYNPHLRGILQSAGRCLMCWLTDKEWKHPKGIIVAGNQGGKCSAKIVDTLVPQNALNVVNIAETFGAEIENVKITFQDPRAKLPSRATEGSAAYDLYPLEDEEIPAHTCKATVTQKTNSQEVKFCL